MCNESSPVSETEGCNFDIDGYLKSAGCDRSTDYGFKENKPCVVLKMNKVGRQLHLINTAALYFSAFFAYS